MKDTWGRLSLFLVMILLLAGCSELTLPEFELPALLSSPTPQPAPTPIGDTLAFQIASPRFNYALQPNQLIPGTQLEFVSKQAGIFNVRIDGFEAQKKAGDSFSWRGIIAPGVVAAYNLRLLSTLRDTDLVANGAVTLDILDPLVTESRLPVDLSTAIIFQEIGIDHIVPIGRRLPGTSLIWQSEANGFVEFAGTTGLPRYALGDSLGWTGSLRSNVFGVYDVKLIGIEPHGLRIRGKANLYVFPTAPIE